MNIYSHSESSYSAVQTIQTSIVGARGYAGLELAKLLLKHPTVKLQSCYATTDFSLSQSLIHDGALSKKAEHVDCLSEEQIFEEKICLDTSDVIFLATPAEVSLQLAPALLKAGKKVIDLSGAFRLKKSSYSQWYGFDHSEPELLSIAEYGLLPFCGPAQSRLIANPGCYATAIAMALIPLLRKKLIHTAGLVIDAKSGTSGAGKKATENLLFSEVSGDCVPYKVGRHQHLPEIQEAVENFSGVQIRPHLATHLLPVDRGISAAIYAETSASSEEIGAAYAQAFADYPLARWQNQIGPLAKLRNVVGTPETHISFDVVDGKLFIFCLIDNLLKGAASQAVENMNRLYNIPLTAGLQEEKL